MRHRGKINGHLLLILAAVGLPLFWYGYTLANQLIYHGIRPHDGYFEVDLKAMGAFPFDAQTDGIQQIPRRFRDLDGKRVMLEGIMYNRDVAGRAVENFEVVYNLQSCCFIGTPQVQERVFARCPAGIRVPYLFNTPIILTGILHVNIERDPEVGSATAVYEVDVEKVEPL